MSRTPQVTIVGAGMAGSELALQLARRGIAVRLHEMRPVRPSEAHQTEHFAELVCSNSFRGDALTNGVGLLKEEMRRAGSILMQIAEETAVPAGGALAVDRERFGARVTEVVHAEELIEVVRGEVTEIPGPEAGIFVVASGPLTAQPLAEKITAMTGRQRLYFYDAVAPIVHADSVDRSIAFAQSRYEKGGGDDYINCPMNKDEYYAFVEALRAAELTELHAFEEARFFEGCLPIEVMASRGDKVLAFGPMKPVGLEDPRTSRRPYAVVQLRMENREGTSYNLVGFQTRMKQPDQGRVFRMIPGLEKAEFMRWGSVHRNTYVHGPEVFDARFAMKVAPHLRFAGQITGVEGYVESQASGLLLALFLAAELSGQPLDLPPATTALGALRRHVTGELAIDAKAYHPTNIHFGMMPPVEEAKSGRSARSDRREAVSHRALADLEAWLAPARSRGLVLQGNYRHPALTEGLPLERLPGDRPLPTAHV